MNQLSKTKKMVLIAVFAAIEVLLACTPLGFIPVGVTRATTVHIPVILGGIMLGPVAGAILGGVFGITSVMINTFSPTITSFVFSPFYSVGAFGGNIYSLIVAIVPRVLIGVTASFTFSILTKVDKTKIVAYLSAGIVGSMTNTILVMGGIYIFFGQSYAASKEIAYESLFRFIMGVVGVNGVPEAIVAAIITATIGKTLGSTLMRNLNKE
ncbi:MAG: ECF transporter S component [Epulopiscium sp.]|nr:ECF transporter S component [Candidatus Epulonipiscium sp.]